MITEWTMYWLTRLDALKSLFGGLALSGWVLGGVGTAVCLIMFAIAKYDDEAAYGHHKVPSEYYVKLKSMRRWFVSMIFSGLFFSIVNAALPTTKEMVAIKVVPMIANNQDIQGLGSDIVNLARDWLKELSPKKEQKTTTEQPK